MKPHKHAELIKAWADGAEIEYKVHNGGWVALEHPSWDDHNEYRIKPEQTVVRWKWAYRSSGEWLESEMFMTQDEINHRQKAFPVDKYFRLEYTRTEFPE